MWFKPVQYANATNIAMATQSKNKAAGLLAAGVDLVVYASYYDMMRRNCFARLKSSGVECYIDAIILVSEVKL